MPVVLVEVGGVARSGHEYDDRTGIAYEYPAGRYEGWIRTGDRFVYQVPRVGYTGCGIVGNQRLSATPGRIICDVESIQMFDSPVGLKNKAGTYFEADKAFWKDRVYWGQGVRPLSDASFNAILEVADSMAPIDGSFRRGGYASPKIARAVEDYSISVALAAMRSRFKAPVRVMPRNNPGYDLLVGEVTDPLRFVEVKGTQSYAPHFFMSEGERQFSHRNSDVYTLLVVSGINLAEASHAHETTHDGSVAHETIEMSPTQWRGQILVPPRSSA